MDAPRYLRAVGHVAFRKQGEPGSSVRMAETNVRSFDLSEWQDFHDGTYNDRHYWSDIRNAQSFRKGDTIIIPGVVADKDNAACLSYWTVDSVSGTVVYCYATTTFIFSEPGTPGNDGDDAVTYAIETSEDAVRLDFEGFVLSMGLEVSAYRTVGSQRSGNILGNAAALPGYYAQFTINRGYSWVECMEFTEGTRKYYGVPEEYIVSANDGLRLRLCSRKNPDVALCTKGLGVVMDGEPGESITGPRGLYIPQPRLWEDYPEGYIFKQGKAGEDRQDLVLVNYGDRIYAVACRKSHVKNADYYPYPPTEVTEAYWETGMQWNIIATRILFAELQYVRNLMAEYIHMEDADGNLLFEVYEGNVRANTGEFRNVKVLGEVTAGEEEGRRILLDPRTQSARIYDAEGNECTRLDGSEYTSATVMPKGTFELKGKGTALTTGLTLRAPEASPTFQQTVEAQATEGSPLAEAMGIVHVKASALIQMAAVASAAAIELPTVRPGNGLDALKPVMLPGASVSCRLDTWVKVTDSDGKPVLDDNGKQKEEVVQSVTRPVAYAAEKIDGTWSSDGTKAVELYVQVPAGRTELTVIFEARGASATAQVKVTEARFVSDYFMSMFFKNGFAQVKNASNYLIALVEKVASGEEVMRLLLGGEFEADGVRQPKVVYMGRVTDASQSASAAPSLTHLTRPTGITAVPTIKKGATYKEGYTLTIPAAYGLTPETAIVEVAGVGPIAGSSDSPAKATEKSRRAGTDGSLVVTVWVSDDASPNYGGFQIKISKV